jgi:hypothetical protein
MVNWGELQYWRYSYGVVLQDEVVDWTAYSGVVRMTAGSGMEE